jgi:hypothetical protein
MSSGSGGIHDPEPIPPGVESEIQTVKRTAVNCSLGMTKA